MSQENLIDTALGLITPDLYLKGGNVIDVYSGEKYEADIVIKDGRIAYVGKEHVSTLAGGCDVIDVSGFNLLPGYIEPHGHPLQIHSSVEYTRVASRHGLTAIVADSYKVLKALGVKKFIAYTEEIKKRTPVKIYWFLRILAMEYPPPEETLYSVDELQELINQPQILCIGETTKWTAILQKSTFPLQAISMFQAAGKRPDGHTSGAAGKKIAALAAAGISGCHESITAENVMDRLRNGMYVMLRHSSQRPDIDNFLDILRDKNVDLSRFMPTTDGTSPAFIEQNWNIASIAEQLITKGIDPFTAVRMLTSNPAAYFRIDHDSGSLTPGRAADIVVTKGFNLSHPQMVLIDGKVVYNSDATAEENRAPFRSSPLTGMRKTYFASGWRVTPEMFAVSVPEGKGKTKEGGEILFPVIEMVNSIITRRLDLLLPVADGVITAGDANPGLLKVALLDMRRRRIGTGFIKGLAHDLEGFASSTCCNLGVIVVIGSSDRAMALAANRVLEMEGGMAVVEDESITWEIGLELPGELTNLSFAEVARLSEELEVLARQKGYSWGDFFHSMHFLPCDFLPYIRISTEGIFDVLRDEIICSSSRG